MDLFVKYLAKTSKIGAKRSINFLVHYRSLVGVVYLKKTHSNYFYTVTKLNGDVVYNTTAGQENPYNNSIRMKMAFGTLRQILFKTGDIFEENGFRFGIIAVPHNLFRNVRVLKNSLKRKGVKVIGVNAWLPVPFGAPRRKRKLRRK